MVVHRRGAMFDVAKFCARLPLPAGPRVQIDHQLVHPGGPARARRRGGRACSAPAAAGAAAELPGRGLRGRGRARRWTATERRLGGGGHRRGLRVRRRRHPCGAGEGGQRSGQAAAHRAAGLRRSTDPARASRTSPGEMAIYESPSDAIYALVGGHRVRPLAGARSGCGAAAGHRRGRRPPAGQPGAVPRTPGRCS